MKFSSIVAAFGALNVALAAPAAQPAVDNTLEKFPFPTGLPTPPGGFPVPTGIPSGLPEPSGLPFDTPAVGSLKPIRSLNSTVVRRSLFGSLKGEKAKKDDEPSPAFPFPSGSFPFPTGAFPAKFPASSGTV